MTVAPPAAEAAPRPTADGSVQTLGADDLATEGEAIAFSRSGGLIRTAIPEFDLSDIPDAAAPTSAAPDLTLTRSASNTGGAETAAIHVFASAEDGAATLVDLRRP